MKVIEFLRVSTQEQANDDRAGLPRQREANARTILKYQLDVIETIELKDVSGTSVIQTPEINRLLSLIKKEDIRGVVVSDLDRLFRPDNFEDFALLQRFKETNTLIYTSDSVMDLRTQSGFIMGGIQSIISGNELTQIKKRMLDAKEIKRKKGEHPNSEITLPTGVSYNRDERKFYYNKDIDKVEKIFKFFDCGIQNYRELERLTGIQHRTIANLLRNEIYIGYRTYTEKRSLEKNIKKDGRQGDRKKIKRIGNEVIRVKAIEMPLIEEKTFYRIQAIISKKGSEYHKKRSKDGQKFLFSGFLRCGECGEPMYTTSSVKNPNKDYYVCRSKREGNQIKACSSSYIPKVLIENSLTALLSEELINVDYMKNLVTKAFDNDNIKEQEIQIGEIRDKIMFINKERLKYLDLYGHDDLFTKEELGLKIEKLNAEKTILDSQLAEISNALLLSDKTKIEQSIKSISETLFDFPYWSAIQKREFLRRQIPEFVVKKEGVMGVTINFGNLCKHMGKDSLRRSA